MKVLNIFSNTLRSPERKRLGAELSGSKLPLGTTAGFGLGDTRPGSKIVDGGGAGAVSW